MPIDMLQDPTGATLFNNMFDSNIDQEQTMQEDTVGQEPIEDSFLASLDEFEKQNQDQDVQQQINELRQQFEIQLQTRDLDEQQQRLEEQLAMQEYYSSTEGQEAVMEKYNTTNYTPQPVEEPAPRYTTVADEISAKESGGNYKALPYKKDGSLASSAVGKYQFLWKKHNPWIKELTGVTNKEDFRNNPQAQEKAFAYWDKTTLTPAALRLKKLIEAKGRTAPDINTLKKYVHFAGEGGAKAYYLTGKQTVDAFGQSIDGYNNITTKDNSVNIKGLNRELKNVLSELSSSFPGIVVTSGNDKTHTQNSTHYDNDGVDVGANSSNKMAYNNLKKYVPILKQKGFNIIDEGDHLHISNSKKGKK